MKWMHNVSSEHHRTRPLAHDRWSWLMLLVQKTASTDTYTEKIGKSHVACPEPLSAWSAAPSRWGNVTLCMQDCTPQQCHVVHAGLHSTDWSRSTLQPVVLYNGHHSLSSQLNVGWLTGPLHNIQTTVHMTSASSNAPGSRLKTLILAVPRWNRILNFSCWYRKSQTTFLSGWANRHQAPAPPCPGWLVCWCDIFATDNQVSGADPIDDHPFTTRSFHGRDPCRSYMPLHLVCKWAVDDGDVTSSVDQCSHWLPLNPNIDAHSHTLAHTINGSIHYSSSGAWSVSHFSCGWILLQNWRICPRLPHPQHVRRGVGARPAISRLTRGVAFNHSLVVLLSCSSVRILCSNSQAFSERHCPTSAFPYCFRSAVWVSCPALGRPCICTVTSAKAEDEVLRRERHPGVVPTSLVMLARAQDHSACR